MSLWNDFISLIYPRSCVCCNHLLLKTEEFICNYCYVNLPKSNFEKENDSELDRVFYGRVPVQKAAGYLLFEKSGKVQKILHSIKYNGNKDLAIKVGEWYGESLKAGGHFINCDVIVPVPLHKEKLSQRGFNQSEEFAIGLSKSLGIPVNSDLLVRNEYTSTQTRKSRTERWENVKDVFEVKDQTVAANKAVLLVDDVITTGATIEACCRAIEKAGAKQLNVVSLAYAKKD